MFYISFLQFHSITFEKNYRNQHIDLAKKCYCIPIS